MRNKADYTKKWFYVSKHTWDEIVQATCQSEVVHEVNVILSLVPILASLWVGAFEVFFVTSILSAGFDLLFVFMQRFNRARILKMMTLNR